MTRANASRAWSRPERLTTKQKQVADPNSWLQYPMTKVMLDCQASVQNDRT